MIPTLYKRAEICGFYVCFLRIVNTSGYTIIGIEALSDRKLSSAFFYGCGRVATTQSARGGFAHLRPSLISINGGITYE